MALLRLAADWAKNRDMFLAVVTVDHGLRPEAADEAALVASTCATLGIEHTTLRWTGWDGSGNLQDRARAARYNLISRWAAEQEIPVVLLAHTVEDQAETLVMRLARASGVDGLSAMSDRRVGPTRFARPLLRCKRQALRDYLRTIGQNWVDDPSNADEKYDRVKIRRHLNGLADLGLTAEALAEVSQNLAQAREALNWAVHQFARDHVRMVGPDVTIEAQPFSVLPLELRRRLMIRVLRWISGSDYAPRRAGVSGLLEAIQRQTPVTLHGCRISFRKGRLWVFREFSAVERSVCAPGQVWDKRWHMSGPEKTGDLIAPIGPDGQRLVPDWRGSGRPAAAIQADPGVWRDGELIAAPVSGWPNGWRANPADPQNDFLSALLTH